VTSPADFLTLSAVLRGVAEFATTSSTLVLPTATGNSEADSAKASANLITAEHDFEYIAAFEVNESSLSPALLTLSWLPGVEVTATA
jgi:hypothetical protein